MAQKAMIAMSGGVDSSVAAVLMAEEGFRCLGATLRLWGDGDTTDARAVADRLGLPFYEYDRREAFAETVVADFIGAYRAGLTPNPCVVCNRVIKFGLLWDLAAELGCDTLVTGHYARIGQDSAGRPRLMKALDKSKDQSYFLACLTPAQLSRVRLPLGELTKDQVRRIAEEKGLINARKRDSQDICFVPDGDFAGFIRRYTGEDFTPGNFVDLSGKVVGTHTGALPYTIGQRKGLGLAMGEPVYVCGKDMTTGAVTVGPNEALFTRELTAVDWNWHTDIPTAPLRTKARIRYRHTEQPATVYPAADGTARVVFDEPQRAITPGQLLVLYEEDTVLACATIR